MCTLWKKHLKCVSHKMKTRCISLSLIYWSNFKAYPLLTYGWCSRNNNRLSTVYGWDLSLISEVFTLWVWFRTSAFVFPCCHQRTAPKLTSKWTPGGTTVFEMSCVSLQSHFPVIQPDSHNFLWTCRDLLEFVYSSPLLAKSLNLGWLPEFS